MPSEGLRYGSRRLRLLAEPRGAPDHADRFAAVRLPGHEAIGGPTERSVGYGQGETPGVFAEAGLHGLIASRIHAALVGVAGLERPDSIPAGAPVVGNGGRGGAG